MAFAIGGNAVVLADRDGFELALPTPAPDAPADHWQAVFEGARLRAERALAQPATHAVVALASDPDSGTAARIRQAAAGAGLEILRLGRIERVRSPRRCLAEDLAPRPEPPSMADARMMPKMVFVERDGVRREVDAPLGSTVLEVAHRNGIDLEGACEGSLACSTCHVIIDPEWYELLREASEDEEDMLDLAFNLTRTSRLGCQIIITEELDGLTVRLPAATRNLLLG